MSGERGRPGAGGTAVNKILKMFKLNLNFIFTIIIRLLILLIYYYIIYTSLLYFRVHVVHKEMWANQVQW